MIQKIKIAIPQDMAIFTQLNKHMNFYTDLSIIKINL